MEIKKIQQKIKRLETTIALEKLKQRKADTRIKIELGGLIIKSGLNNLPKSVILGILLDVKERIKDKSALEHFEALGNLEFAKNEKQ